MCNACMNTLNNKFTFGNVPRILRSYRMSPARILRFDDTEILSERRLWSFIRDGGAWTLAALVLQYVLGKPAAT